MILVVYDSKGQKLAEAVSDCLRHRDVIATVSFDELDLQVASQATVIMIHSSIWYPRKVKLAQSLKPFAVISDFVTSGFLQFGEETQRIRIGLEDMQSGSLSEETRAKLEALLPVA